MFIEKQHHSHCWSSDIPVIDFFIFVSSSPDPLYGLCVSVTLHPPRQTICACLYSACLLFFFFFQPNSKSVGVSLSWRCNIASSVHRPRKSLHTFIPELRVTSNRDSDSCFSKQFTIPTTTPKLSCAPTHTHTQAINLVMSCGYFGIKVTNFCIPCIASLYRVCCCSL